MGKIAWVFPGQGSQYVGMGQEVTEAYPEAREVFEKADEVLGFSLTQLCMHGEEAELRKTENTQPAILTTSIALLRVLRRKEVPVDFVAGHSLGEFSALVAAGALQFEDAVRLVRIRGKLMEEAVPAGKGAMAAVLGMDQPVLAEICEQVSAAGQPVDLANLNCPGQIVISGTRQGVEDACRRAREAGARRTMMLEVSGPFHSRLMQPAADKFRKVLDEVNLSEAQVPVVANVTALPVQDPGEIRELLYRQVASPVRWEESIRWLLSQGVETFVEIGPGSVLSGLIRKVDRKVQTFQVEKPSDLEKVWDHFA
ncbi:MAG: malonyl CoA-acyl carrier protein transacylase [Bacillus thermozeamaize]|uniref:Malonyl CoA-acyl carrier protein transacylase n=1 Tax=Bacillus thermozeamaize TaxID=230954 RepID=A0A1Y3PLS4_9BACI|nr:MAG: malonyl CoA-acyl carrier protein transacylase [Bacillus thermozeamaize]